MRVPSFMKAAVALTGSQATDNESIIDVKLPVPKPGDRDLLVRVEAISVNPVDTKMRLRAGAPGRNVLGWDVSGTVVEVGAKVSLLAPGDEVYYCGSIDRPGANSEYHLVDERLVGQKPSTLSFAEAAALPLTTLTAWESLFHNFQIPLGSDSLDRCLLIAGGAGGVGSIAIQLARPLTNATIIATASKPASIEWTKRMGAHHTIDHHGSLSDQVTALTASGVTDILSSQATDQHYAAYTQIIAPRGRITVLDEPTSIRIMDLKGKSASLLWENVFTRPAFQTSDMHIHGKILNDVGRLVDTGLIQSTLRQEIGQINAKNLRETHRMLESGAVIGKLVLTGF